MIEIDNKETFIEKAYCQNNIAVVLESSQYFIPYLDVMIKSLLHNMTDENNYDIIILGNEIDSYDQHILQDVYHTYENVSIRFFNPDSLVKKYIEQAKYQYLHINYYRLALPWILCKYDKVIQLGADIVIKRDLAELYRESLGDNEYLAGVVDLGYLGRLKMDIPKEELGMHQPETYVNADVLLYNLRKIREDYSMEDIMSVWQKYRFRCSEQDALNMIFDGKVKLLDSRWNVFPVRMVSEMHIACSPEELQKQRKKDLKDPFIVHFAAIPKPWEYPMVGEGIAWWEYARASVYYEEILRRLMIYTIKIETSIPPQQSLFRRVVEKIIPRGTRRRAFVNRVIPRGSWHWRIFKKIYDKMRAVSAFCGNNHSINKYGKLGE